MQIIDDFSQIPQLKPPIALTIGVYDGVHLGHQLIFKHLHKWTRKKGTRVILTFSNHPMTFFNPQKPFPLIMTLDYRLNLFNFFGFDIVLLFPFDHYLANFEYDRFIEMIHNKIPFSHLVLGEGAAFGKNRSGDATALSQLGKKFNFTTEYLPKATYHKEVISSDAIRNYLNRGELKKAKKMLGHPYCLRFPYVAPILEDKNRYRLDLQVEGLVALPEGVYAINIEKIPGIAFYCISRNIMGRNKISLTIHFEKQLPKTSHFFIYFISYLYKEPTLTLSEEESLLEKLKPQFIPS